MLPDLLQYPKAAEKLDPGRAISMGDTEVYLAIVVLIPVVFLWLIINTCKVNGDLCYKADIHTMH